MPVVGHFSSKSVEMLYPSLQQALECGPFVQDVSATFVDVPETAVDVEELFETRETLEESNLADDVDSAVVLTLLEVALPARRTCFIVVGLPPGPQT